VSHKKGFDSGARPERLNHFSYITTAESLQLLRHFSYILVTAILALLLQLHTQSQDTLAGSILYLKRPTGNHCFSSSLFSNLERLGAAAA
jgi:hypothetical protein